VELGETVNNIIGRTLNPVNQLLSCGGSSGGAVVLSLIHSQVSNGRIPGEGALNALRGSTLGVGTDIGY
jgi:amidase